jgi:predicted alpha/beta hydrolase
MADNVRTAIVTAADGHSLTASVFETDRRPRAITVIASATGVPRRYYSRFAQQLVARGSAVMTFDYRGIGDSLVGSVARSPARFRDWGILDIPAAIDFARRSFPALPICWVGHSYGGFGTGLAHNNHLIARHLGVATTTADLRLVRSPLARAKVRALLGIVAPTLAHGLGYVPGALNGNSLDLPKHVALEWSRWVRTPGFLFGLRDLPERRYFAQQTSALRFLHMSDDPWVERIGIEHLAAQFPCASERSIVEISPAAAGVPRIGHIGFFRSELAATAWPQAIDWVLAHTAR